MNRLLHRLPHALRAIREAEGLTQTSLAARIREKTGQRIKASRLSEWEKGRSTPSCGSLAAILVALDTDFRGLQDALDGKLSPFVEEDDEEIDELVGDFLGRRRLEVDPAARQRLRDLMKMSAEFPDLVRRLERIEAKEEEPNGTDG